MALSRQWCDISQTFSSPRVRVRERTAVSLQRRPASCAAGQSRFLLLAVDGRSGYQLPVAWDKRATVRRGDTVEFRGTYIVYLGLTDHARSMCIGEPPRLNAGDAFRLLPGAAITFGRSELCEVTIASTHVSRAHALIAFVPGGNNYMALFDLQSRSGSWVGGRNRPLHLISDGSEFSLGKAFRFRCQPARVK